MAASSMILSVARPGMVPNLPTTLFGVGKFKPLQRNGFPNLPNLPNLAPRVHKRTHTRVCVYAHDEPVKRLGRLGRLGRSRQDNGRMFPTSKRVVGRLGSWLITQFIEKVLPKAPKQGLFAPRNFPRGCGFAGVAIGGASDHSGLPT